MIRSFMKNIPVVILALLFIIGCATTNNKDDIKKVVQEEIKSELKGINDFLNVAYAYDINPESLENLARMNESIKAIKMDLVELKKTMIKARLGGASGANAEAISKEIDEKFSSLDKRLEKMIDDKLVQLIEKIENNRLALKEHKLDIKSNSIDISNNRVAIRDNTRQVNESRIAIEKHDKEIEANKLLLAKDIETNKNAINVNKQDISELKKSSARLMLNINQAK